MGAGSGDIPGHNGRIECCVGGHLVVQIVLITVCGIIIIDPLFLGVT